MTKDDSISRQAAIDALKNRWKKTRNYEGIGDDIAEECELYLNQLPSAQPKTMRVAKITLSDEQIQEAVEKVKNEAVQVLPSAQPEIKPISYQDCANAMMMMWMDNVLTDGEYRRIMDRLNDHESRKENR